MSSTSASSARKKSVTHTSPLKLQQSLKDIMHADKELLRGISQKEVEIDHLKTALHAVSLRLEVLKDKEKDV